MIITISGKAGSGKSTVAKMLAKELGLKHYSIGDLMREMAKERGISLIELNKLAEKNKSIDMELDKKLIELGKAKDDFVVDGRLTAFFIPHADVKIFLDTDDKVRAQRILVDHRELEEGKDIAIVMGEIKKREKSEKKRYMDYYGADYYDKRIYDSIIDTTKLSPQQVIDKIMGIIKGNKKG